MVGRWWVGRVGAGLGGLVVPSGSPGKGGSGWWVGGQLGILYLKGEGKQDMVGGGIFLEEMAPRFENLYIFFFVLPSCGSMCGKVPGKDGPVFQGYLNLQSSNNGCLTLDVFEFLFLRLSDIG